MIHCPVKESQIADPNTGHVRDRWLETFQRLCAAFGTWTPVPYDAGNFSWDVEEADQIAFAYAAYGQRVDLDIVLQTTTSGAVASVTVALPARFVAGRASSSVVLLGDNGTPAAGLARVTDGGTVITIRRLDGAAFTDLRSVEGQLSIEVQQ